MISVAIDGPAGAGKSTIAKAVAEKMGFIYVDTGALYRAIGYFVASNGGDTKEENEILPMLLEMNVELKYENGVQKVFVNDSDVSEKIRTPEMSMNASNVSAVSEVRTFLLDLQKDIAKKNNVIMDGRDIGTVVLPNANVKIFLTASPQIRAKRRYDELTQKGQKVNLDEILKDIIARDYQDSNREIAPLKQADGAFLVDTSNLTLKESIDYLEKTIKKNI